MYPLVIKTIVVNIAVETEGPGPQPLTGGDFGGAVGDTRLISAAT
jgi:hypothetical protein